MSLLQIDGLSKAFGADVLFDPFCAQLARGDRVALIGDNGVGKSTLLRIIAAEETPSEGAVRRIGDVQVAYLPQSARLQGAGTLRQAMDQPFRKLRQWEVELRRMEEAIAAGDHAESTLLGYDEKRLQFERSGGYEIEARLRATLTGVGLGLDMLDRDVRRLSGGEEARAALAQVLLESPDVLMLDEPTNHLDFDALDWLEETLQQLPGALILISHDRHLLDRVATRTWEIAFEEVTVYSVGYSRSREEREAHRARRLEAFRQQEETLEKYRDFIRRNKAGQKVRQAKDREKKLERIEQTRVEQPRDAKRISLRIPDPEPSGKRVVSTKGLQVGYDAPLICVPDIELHRGEKVAIIGPNGCGKTTLLNTLLGEIPPLAGKMELGHQVKVATFRQKQEGFHGQGSVLQSILSRASLSISEARGLLGRFLFSGDDVDKRMDDLSGGERSRVALAVLSLVRGNLLLLDEPTNHLDLASQEILERALVEYPGTILLVSHDRALLEAVTTQVWWIEGSALRVYGDGYAAVRARRQEEATRAQHKPKPNTSPPRRSPSNARRPDRKVAETRCRLEAEIESMEQQLQDIEASLLAASTAGDAEMISSLGVQHAQVQQQLRTRMNHWDKLADDEEAGG